MHTSARTCGAASATTIACSSVLGFFDAGRDSRPNASFEISMSSSSDEYARGSDMTVCSNLLGEPVLVTHMSGDTVTPKHKTYYHGALLCTGFDSSYVCERKDAVSSLDGD